MAISSYANTQNERALAGARLFQRHLGRRREARAAQIAFAVASHHAENGEYTKALKHLKATLRSIDARADYDIQVQPGLRGMASRHLRVRVPPPRRVPRRAQPRQPGPGRAHPCSQHRR